MTDSRDIRAHVRYHIHIDIDDQLMKSDDQLDRIAAKFSADGVPIRTGAEVRALLMVYKMNGWGVILPSECDHYDKKTGCLGHIIQEEKEP